MLQILCDILNFVVENGRVDGTMDSAVAEVQFEADERGVDISDVDIEQFVEAHFVE